MSDRFRPEGYFEPAWMSSTYAIREIDKITEGLSKDEYYYKECAFNARNPENEADPFERAFLDELQTHPDLTERSSIRTFDGKPFLVILRRGEVMEESCLRCHSGPELAPADLVARYGEKRSFHRNVGEVASAISMRIPLAAGYGAADRIAFQLSGFLLAMLLSLVAGLYYLNRRVVINPLASLRSKVLQIASDDSHLGESIPLPAEIELRELAQAFNSMSVSLRQSRHQLKERIAERTAQLEAINEQLRVEIAERIRTAQALKESSEQYRTVVEDQTDLIRRATSECVLTFVNSAYCRFFGETPEELLGRDYWRHVHSDDVHRLKSHLASLSFDNPTGTIDHHCITSTGEIRWIRWLDRAIFNESGGIVEFQSVGRDITEQHDLESKLRQVHKMEAVGTLAGGIAHEFNNILGIILGNTELALLDIPERNPEREYLEVVRKACLRAREIVRQLLSFSRKADPERGPLDIGLLTKESLKLLRASIPKNIEIREAIPHGLPHIVADATQIHQVIINLCTNAAHAMEDTGGVLDVRLSDIELHERLYTQFIELEPGRYVLLTVSDTGLGIEPEFIPRVFDPYFTTKEVGKGSGMGLAVVHGIIKSHSGGIAVESTGEGTTFHLYFPVPERRMDTVQVVAEPTFKGQESVLLVDDEHAMASMGQKMLMCFGYSVEVSTSSIEALELIREDPERFDLVITDMNMPKMTGDVLAREIMSIRPDMPVILCTGFNERINEAQARKAGIRHFVLKPFSMDDLARAVRKALDEG